MAKDIIIGIVIIFAFAIGYFSFHYAFNIAADKMINNTYVNESKATVDVLNEGKQLSNRLDYVLLIVFVGVALGIVITRWFIGGNPIFMFVYFIILVVATILASVFHYVWEQVSSASVFGTTSLFFPITGHILSHLEIYTPVIGFLGVIAMFAKPFLVRE